MKTPDEYATLEDFAEDVKKELLEDENFHILLEHPDYGPDWMMDFARRCAKRRLSADLVALSQRRRA
jgi:hypothetical protein